MKYSLTIILIFLLTAQVFAQIPADSIKAIIRQEVAGKRSKSMIVGILDATGRHTYAAGKISETDPRLPDGNTIYEIGSITKVFTSLLLADMSLKKQLNLNDPISKYLPKNVKTPIRNGKEISLLSLSTHRSGMPRFPYNTDPKNPDQPYIDYSIRQLYEYIANFKPPYDIDSKWKYSNVAYGLLGNILSRVSHKGFEDLVVSEICKPLNMNHTSISLSTAQKANLALGHSETGRPVGLTDLGAIEGGGGLRSTVGDLLNFAEANLGLRTTALYPAMQLTHAAQARKDDGDAFSTMGWTLVNQNGRSLVFKDGGMPGYCSFIGIDPTQKFAVVILSNSNNSVTDIGRHILDSNYARLPYKYPWGLLDTLRTTFTLTKDIERTISLYNRLEASSTEPFVFNEYQLDQLGQELGRQHKIKEAIQIFKFNLKEYPNTTLVYESLGEIYKRTGNLKLAIQYFELARELEPENQHWNYLLQKLRL